MYLKLLFLIPCVILNNSIAVAQSTSDLAIGGANGGYPSQTSFPKKFEIDYVRVYQKIK